MKKGFTLVELLAVIIVLAIILAIVVPPIVSVLSDATRKAFADNTLMVLKTIQYKAMQNEDLDVTSINESNIDSVLGIVKDNYNDVVISDENDEYKVTIEGKNKWAGYVSYGTYSTVVVKSLPSGLIGRWDMDGNFNDSSGNNHNGTVNGAILTYDRHGVANNAYHFDGSDDYINLGNIGLASLTNGTVSFWRKNDNNNQWLLFQGQITAYFLFATSGTGAFYNSYAGPDIKIYVDGVASTTPITDGKWHHYVATGVDLSIWNSILLSNYPGYQYNGSLDELRIYNRSLTTDEITTLYEMEK